LIHDGFLQQHKFDIYLMNTGKQQLAFKHLKKRKKQFKEEHLSSAELIKRQRTLYL